MAMDGTLTIFRPDGTTIVDQVEVFHFDVDDQGRFSYRDTNDGPDRISNLPYLLRKAEEQAPGPIRYSLS